MRNQTASGLPDRHEKGRSHWADLPSLTKTRLVTISQILSTWVLARLYDHSSKRPIPGTLPARRLTRHEQHLRSLFGLAPEGVYTAAMITHDAVSSYLTLSPLPALPPAVCFLWHFNPDLGIWSEASDLSIGLPALRCPDFPLPKERSSVIRHEKTSMNSMAEYPTCFQIWKRNSPPGHTRAGLPSFTRFSG